MSKPKTISFDCENAKTMSEKQKVCRPGSRYLQKRAFLVLRYLDYVFLKHNLTRQKPTALAIENIINVGLLSDSIFLKFFHLRGYMLCRIYNNQNEYYRIKNTKCRHCYLPFGSTACSLDPPQQTHQVRLVQSERFESTALKISKFL
mmetsp:Transcript_6788/g.8564  ORF Transcript_6788/g.8564 Transcript_6788/m.8564 type:complete len:147 (-) Transcript_6788:59-499(-)